MTSISELRTELDRIDDQIIALIAERMQVSSAIGKKKAQAHSPVFDGDREAEVLDRWIKGATARGLDTKPMEDILAIILSQSRAIQEGR